MYDVINMSDLIVRYFSSDLWLTVFIISVIYLFFRVNVSGKRAVFAALTAFFLIINRYVIKAFTILGENSTFYRHLWAIPSIAIIGIAIVDIIKMLPRWFLKLSAILAFAIILWHANQTEYIRCRSQIISSDAKMVSENVINIGNKFDALREEIGKRSIYVVCPIGYEHSYGNMPTELSLYSGYLKISNSSILNDADHNGEAELTGETPDVSYIMSTCCSNGIDYVIVSRNNGVEKEFKDYGFTPVFNLDSYLVYHCEGYKGYTQEENGQGQIVKKMFINEKGKLERNGEGYCIVRYIYDRIGNKTEENYFDEADVPCIIPSGYAGIAYEYNENRAIICEEYLDTAGQLTNRDYGYARVLREYNENNKLIRETYEDKKGRRVLSLDGIAGFERKYDLHGNIIEELYLDENDNLKACVTGYARIRRTYNEQNQIIWEYYENTDGSLFETRSGYAYLQREYDNKGNVSSEKYYSINGELVFVIEREYDENHNQIKETYLNKIEDPD